MGKTHEAAILDRGQKETNDRVEGDVGPAEQGFPAFGGSAGDEAVRNPVRGREKSQGREKS